MINFIKGSNNKIEIRVIYLFTEKLHQVLIELKSELFACLPNRQACLLKAILKAQKNYRNTKNILLNIKKSRPKMRQLFKAFLLNSCLLQIILPELQQHSHQQHLSILMKQLSELLLFSQTQGGLQLLLSCVFPGVWQTQHHDHYSTW